MLSCAGQLQLASGGREEEEEEGEVRFVCDRGVENTHLNSLLHSLPARLVGLLS